MSTDLVFEMKQRQPVSMIITANHRSDCEAIEQEKDKASMQEEEDGGAELLWESPISNMVCRNKTERV